VTFSAVNLKHACKVHECVVLGLKSKDLVRHVKM